MIVIWEATHACALACRHCRADAVRQRDPAELDAFGWARTYALTGDPFASDPTCLYQPPVSRKDQP